MTRVNVTFGTPEPYFGVELDAQSQAAWDRHEAAENPDEVWGLWDEFIAEFERQVRPMMGNRGYVSEVYEGSDDE